MRQEHIADVDHNIENSPLPSSTDFKAEVLRHFTATAIALPSV